MMIKTLSKFLVVLFIFGLVLDVDAQRKKRKKKKTQTELTIKSKPKPTKGGLQPYSKLITKDMKTDEGLFKVHSKDQKYLFEISDTLMEREMLMVTRIAKTASGIGFGGGKVNTQVLRWQRKEQQILLRVVSYTNVADTILPVHEAVVNSNFEPILHSFPIKALNADSTGVVIDASPLLTSDVKLWTS